MYYIKYTFQSTKQEASKKFENGWNIMKGGRNLELASKWPNGIPEGVQKEIYDIDTKIRELNWTTYDD